MPGISLIKEVVSTGPYPLDSTITYGFIVMNTGTTVLENVTVNDPLLGGAVACAETTLGPSESTNCGPVDYVVTSADVRAGSVFNTATVSGTPPVTDPLNPPGPVTDSDSTTTPTQAAVVPVNAYPVPTVDWRGLLLLALGFLALVWRARRRAAD